MMGVRSPGYLNLMLLFLIMILCAWMVWMEVTPSSLICWMANATIYMVRLISFYLSQPVDSFLFSR